MTPTLLICILLMASSAFAETIISYGTTSIPRTIQIFESEEGLKCALASGRDGISCDWEGYQNKIKEIEKRNNTDSIFIDSEYYHTLSTKEINRGTIKITFPKKTYDGFMAKVKCGFEDQVMSAKIVKNNIEVYCKEHQ